MLRAEVFDLEARRSHIDGTGRRSSAIPNLPEKRSSLVNVDALHVVLGNEMTFRTVDILLTLLEKIRDEFHHSK